MIETKERLLLLKLVNGLYGVSLAENALNTQHFLSKIILFLRYYASDEAKLVRLKDEFDIMRLFAELMTMSSGNPCNFYLDIGDRELLNLYIPSKSLLCLMIGLLTDAAAPEGQTCDIWIKTRREGEKAILCIEKIDFTDPYAVKALAGELSHALAPLHEAAVHMARNEEEPQTVKIVITLKM